MTLMQVFDLPEYLVPAVLAGLAVGFRLLLFPPQHLQPPPHHLLQAPAPPHPLLPITNFHILGPHEQGQK